MTCGLKVALATLAILAFGVAGCEKRAEAGLAKDKGPGKMVDEAEFKAAGKTWPLTVSEARVGCDAPGALYVLSDGKKYGLNDWASGLAGVDDLSAIRVEAKKGVLGVAAKKSEDPAPRKKRGGRVKAKTDYVPTDDLVLAARTACRW